MTRKVILVLDPGIDGAFTLAAALRAPQLEVLAVVAAAGGLPAEVATHQLHQLVEMFDPPRLPRLGAALATPPCPEPAPPWMGNAFNSILPSSRGLHNLHPGDKVISDEVQLHKGEVTVITTGPLTPLAVAGDRHPDLARLLKSLIVAGGALQQPGNAGPVAEFNFYVDPTSARQVLRSGVPLTLLPLDVSSLAVFAPSDLEQYLAGNSAIHVALRKLLPTGLRAMSDGCGVEGLQLSGLVTVAIAAEPGLAKTRSLAVDVETLGQLTRGMMVIERRSRRAAPNVDCVVEIDWTAVRACLDRLFRQ
ncbi:MAG TPA: nucleoside hydrolase [Gemmatales bacterium]|nr:nucleoside hydrolase [Gemmatales bacterium]